MLDAKISQLVADYGVEVKAKLAGAGEPEEALRVPIEHLITAVGDFIGKKTILDGEAHLTELSSRPDFAVRVKGAVVGYIEVKKAGLSLDPGTFSGHNRDQWNRLKDLPNLVYTNGTEWRLYRGDAQPALVAQLTGGPLDVAGAGLSPDSAFAHLLTDFLNWHPVPIKTVGKLVSTIAPITRMLRTKVIEQLAYETAEVKAGAPAHQQLFLGLANDWRKLLFPDASDEVFADGYAQTVTFALLLARSEKIDLESTTLYEVGQQLGADHSLMGKALQLLTNDVKGDFVPTIDLLRRVIGAVQWDAVRKNKDTYLHLYENFLAEYDPELRKATGTYYTPHEVVDQMVRLAEEALVTKLGKPKGFLDPSVTTIDPAMGTGTFLHSIIEHVAEKVGQTEGPGAVPGTITELASRLIGFELQLGSYTVAELRTTDLLHSYSAMSPKGGMRMFVADTLSDPDAVTTNIASSLAAISESKAEANRIKAEVPVTVVIGNPPYGDKAEGLGGWIEKGSEATSNDKGAKVARNAPLDAFRIKGNGLTEFILKNLYVYFWRWATWKVFESVPAQQSGVICYITSSGYFRGPGTKGLRKYLRRESSEGWIIDLTPEGKRPPAKTAVFNIETPVAIAIFVRRDDVNRDVPAPIHYISLHGTRGSKFQQLKELDLTPSDRWALASSEWTAAIVPAGQSLWTDAPALSDLIAWVGPGIAANRNWPYAPLPKILQSRWDALKNATSRADKSKLFKETVDARLDRVPKALVGSDTQSFVGSFGDSQGDFVGAVRAAFRSFDRQWIVPDPRVLHRPTPLLWEARSSGQVFTGEQHSVPVGAGAVPISFTPFVVDLNYTDNRGGRVLPLLHPDGTPNLAPGLLEGLAAEASIRADHEDLLAYVAGVVAHPAFTATFVDELTTPGVRVPITRDAALWQKAVELGREVIWLHTYAQRYVDPAAGREAGNVRSGWPIDAQPKSLEAVTTMPVKVHYDDVRGHVVFTDDDGGRNGAWGPVSREVFDYTVGGMNVIGSWFKYRKKNPGGKKTSPLDDIHVDEWPHEWTLEFTELLTVLTRLVSLEPAQAALLEQILAGDLITKDELASAGVRWPETRDDRKPRRKVAADTLDIFGEGDER
jgi:hypothetical protein